jgi:hypothetical protein
MAEFTLINRRKNLIFLQSPPAPALAPEHKQSKFRRWKFDSFSLAKERRQILIHRYALAVKETPS